MDDTDQLLNKNSANLEVPGGDYPRARLSAQGTKPNKTEEVVYPTNRAQSEDTRPNFHQFGKTSPNNNRASARIEGMDRFGPGSIMIDVDDDDEYIDSSEVSDELFRSVEAFSTDDEDEYE